MGHETPLVGGTVILDNNCEAAKSARKRGVRMLTPAGSDISMARSCYQPCRILHPSNGALVGAALSSPADHCVLTSMVTRVVAGWSSISFSARREDLGDLGAVQIGVVNYV